MGRALIMAEEKVLEGEETHIMQVGVVVKDLDKTVEFLTTLGLGPFRVIVNEHPNAEIRGKKGYWKSKVAMAKQGPVELELIQVLEGEGVQKEFLDERGEGIHHLLFKVRDINATVEKFSKKGIPILQRDWFPGHVGGGGYMDTTAIGGISLEVMEIPPEFDSDEGRDKAFSKKSVV
jgi:methylmalonyl-CoA/ethylmalonyl-CoA epimerase